MENWFLHHNFLQGIMGSPVVGSTSSCREHPPVVGSTSSCREHPPVVESTLQLSGPGIYSFRKHPQLSGVSKEPTVVWTTYSCREHLQLSRAPSVIQSTPSCREHLHLSKVPPAVESDFCQTGSAIPLEVSWIIQATNIYSTCLVFRV